MVTHGTRCADSALCRKKQETRTIMYPTHAHTTRSTHFLQTLLLLVIALCGLAATHSAQAQTPYLPKYAINVTLRYSSSGQSNEPLPTVSYSGPLKVISQDSNGNFTGTLSLSNGVVYSVKGNCAFADFYDKHKIYNFSFDATAQVGFGVTRSTVTLHYDNLIVLDILAGFTTSGQFTWSRTPTIVVGPDSGKGTLFLTATKQP